MFDRQEHPRVFGVPPGADFPGSVAAGLLERLGDAPPEALARVLILANSARMRRALQEAFRSGPARLLPRIALVTEIDRIVPDAELAEPTAPLLRRLELARLIAPLLEGPASPAPRSALFDVADSLATLLDEMHEEAVPPARIERLNGEWTSGHWQQALVFLGIVQRYLDATGAGFSDPAARRRQAMMHLLKAWTAAPPATPVLVVGSTGSRGTTFELMAAVARLPQGAVILPGFDGDLTPDTWSAMSERDTPLEDHPQYRYAALCKTLGISPSQAPFWTDEVPDAARNRLISLALRPAPVTDQWRSEGRALGDLRAAVSRVALIEAPQPRDEALAIAIALRDAVARNETAALITPDRTLGRRVASALARWDIVPDDSAGIPLTQSAPGRFLRHVLGQIGAEPTADKIIPLLKHPLAHSAGGRGDHLLATRELELFLRRERLTHVTRQVLARFCADARSNRFVDWADWLSERIAAFETPLPAVLGDAVSAHVALAEHLACGAVGRGSGALWEKTPGTDTRAAVEGLRHPGAADTPITAADYRALFDHVLATSETRERDEVVHPNVMIWGTLEARVQGADLVILGGLNEGVWPPRPDPDPWLNRSMRREAGLLVPERRVGLSAHDFQQAAGAKNVILSRAKRDAEAETVPSRWVNRLVNLLGGLTEADGPAALDDMRARGTRFLDIAHRLERPASKTEAAPRPSPAPPAATRPARLSVTDIEKLLRDPYAVYARRVLGLRRLDPICAEPDAAMRGTVFHAILRTFIENGPVRDVSADRDRLLSIAETVLRDAVPWPAVREEWQGHLAAIAPAFLTAELARQRHGKPLALEVRGEMPMPGPGIVLTGQADRIDRLGDGRLAIYDYKTGGPPTDKEIHFFQRQLLIEAVMAERGGFEGIDPAEVAQVVFLGLNRSLDARTTLPAEGTIGQGSSKQDVDYRTSTIAAELEQLLEHFGRPSRGFTSRRAMRELRYDGDYDHLARYGEWDETDDPIRIDLS